MSKWASRLAVVALAAMVVLVAAGCDDVNKLKADNQALKDGNTALQQKLDQAAADKAALEAENARLKADLAAQMAANKVPPFVPQPPVVAPVKPVDTTPPAKPDDFDKDLDVTRDRNAITINMAGDVLFASGKAALKPDALATLDKIAKVIKSRYGSNKLRVIGHTDSDPIKKSGWKDNLELSMARAKAVGDYLVRQGMPATNLEITGVGSTDPRVSETTKEDKAKNRRVVVQVILKS